MRAVKGGKLASSHIGVGRAISERGIFDQRMKTFSEKYWTDPDEWDEGVPNVPVKTPEAMTQMLNEYEDILKDYERLMPLERAFLKSKRVMDDETGNTWKWEHIYYNRFPSTGVTNPKILKLQKNFKNAEWNLHRRMKAYPKEERPPEMYRALKKKAREGDHARFRIMREAFPREVVPSTKSPSVLDSAPSLPLAEDAEWRAEMARHQAESRAVRTQQEQSLRDMYRR